MTMTAQERSVLRDLARRVADIAAMPVMGERRELWKKHNSLKAVRPLVLVFPEGSWRELLPETSLRCEGKEARGIERGLRRSLYSYEHFHDDAVVVGTFPVRKVFRSSGWGLEAKWRFSTEELGARTFDPVILEPADLKKLKAPEVSLDEPATKQRLQDAQELFGDILDVRLIGVDYLGFHTMNMYTALRGLDQVMMDMVENPAMLDDAMAFYEEAHHGLIRQYVALGLLTLNNDNSYHSSGGNGWTDELPKAGFDPARVRPCDVWASAEAQEMALVSPEMHERFILSHERRLLAQFGLSGYGCCEDLTRKLDYVLTIPNIRRISISPFANADACARKLKGGCIFSWKPQPSQLVGQFNVALIRDYVAHTLDVCAENGCVLEIILKDTHTCENHPERFTEWTRIVRELIAARYG